jgi:hypothetical protein
MAPLSDIADTVPAETKRFWGGFCGGRRVVEPLDVPNLVSCAGLVPVLQLADRVGLTRLAAEHVVLPGPAGANAEAKVTSLVAGMVAGADSIEDMDLLRHGGMDRLTSGVRAPLHAGHFLALVQPRARRQLHAVAVPASGRLGASDTTAARCRRVGLRRHR